MHEKSTTAPLEDEEEGPEIHLEQAETIYNEIEASKIKEHVKYITENGFGRSVGSPTNKLIRGYFASTIAAYREDAIREEIGEYQSPIVTFPGSMTGNSNKTIIVGANIDSYYLSPGANANAGGLGAVIEIARILAQYDMPIDVAFVGFNAYFNNHMGCREVIWHFAKTQKDIAVLFNFDRILWPGDESKEPIYEARYAQDLPITMSSYWAKVLSIASEKFGKGIMLPKGSHDRSSVYGVFWSYSIPAVGIRAGGTSPDPFFGTPEDSYKRSDLDYVSARELVASTAAIIALWMRAA